MRLPQDLAQANGHRFARSLRGKFGTAQEDFRRRAAATAGIEETPPVVPLPPPFCWPALARSPTRASDLS